MMYANQNTSILPLKKKIISICWIWESCSIEQIIYGGGKQGCFLSDVGYFTMLIDL